MFHSVCRKAIIRQAVPGIALRRLRKRNQTTEFPTMPQTPDWMDILAARNLELTLQALSARSMD